MIRSLTIGLPLATKSPSHIRERVRGFLEIAIATLEAADLAPRTVRFALPAVGQEGEIEGAILSRVRFVDELSADTGVRWMCLPIDLVADGLNTVRMAAAIDVIGRFPRLFLNLIVAEDGKIAVNSVNQVADLILKISRRSNNGFDNFRVGASCNCPPNSPFFPFSQHKGDNLAFSFALETTNLAVEATKSVQGNVALAREHLIEALVPTLRKVQSLAEELASKTDVEFRGMDASLAPFPGDGTSVGALVEQLLGASVGSHGSVFITAMLTDALRCALKESGAKPVGFNGVMYSMLEDKHLASANSKRNVTLDGLVSLAAVCGCGIDMVPVSGICFQEEIAAVILDIAAMSSTLKKPLGVRMLPIPNRGVNEFTQLNLDFLCDSRVVPLTANDRKIVLSEHLFEMRAPLK